MKALTILAASCAAILPATASFSADMYQVAAGATVTINEHNVCRKVTNGGSNPIMVPTGSRDQWATGQGAFLTNVAMMSGVSVSNCIADITVNAMYYAAMSSNLGTIRGTSDN